MEITFGSNIENQNDGFDETFGHKSKNKSIETKIKY